MPSFTARCGCQLYAYVYEDYDGYTIEDAEIETPCETHAGLTPESSSATIDT